MIGVYNTEDDLISAGRRYSKFWDVVESIHFANLRIEEGDGGDTSQFIDYSKMKPMPTGKWKRKDLSNYNKTRINPVIVELICPWCGEKGYGYEFRKKHLSTGYDQNDPNRYNCSKNPNRVLNYNEKVFDINGEKLTINDIVNKYSLTRSVVQNRLFQGWDIKNIIHVPMNQDATYKLDNEYLTIPAIIKKLGVSRKPIEWCIKNKLEIQTYADRLRQFRLEGHFTCPNCKKVYSDQKQIVKHFEKCPKLTKVQHFNSETYFLDGKRVTIQSVQIEYGMLEKTLRTRIKKQNKTMKEALHLGMVNRAKKEIFFNNRVIKLSDFLTQYQIDEDYFYRYFGKSKILEIANKTAI